MEEKNSNIFDVLGKYNTNGGEVRNVTSSDWTPISAGSYNRQAQTSDAAKRQSAQKKSQSGNKGASKKSTSSSKGTAKNEKSSPKSVDERRFISDGNPSEKKASQNKKSTSSAKNSSKKSSQTNKNTSSSESSHKKSQSASRTPTGRDMREDAKQKQKHREDLLRSREDYRRRSREGENHDEISRDRNADKRRRMALKNAAPIAVVIAFVLFFMGIYCYNRGALIENIIIDGSSVYSAEEIYEAAGILKGKNMLSLRESKVKKDLTTKLPYIKDVKLERELPDTVILTIRSTADKYIISGDTLSLTLDTDGKIVSTMKQSLEDGLYRIDGFEYQDYSEGDTYKPNESNKIRYELMQKIVAGFDKSGVVTSAIIELRDTENVRVIYKDKIAVYLGDCKNLEEQIPYASGIIAQVDAKGLGGYIDMRFEPAPFMPGGMEIQ